MAVAMAVALPGSLALARPPLRLAHDHAELIVLKTCRRVQGAYWCGAGYERPAAGVPHRSGAASGRAGSSGWLRSGRSTGARRPDRTSRSRPAGSSGSLSRSSALPPVCARRARARGRTRSARRARPARGGRGSRRAARPARLAASASWPPPAARTAARARGARGAAAVEACRICYRPPAEVGRPWAWRCSLPWPAWQAGAVLPNVAGVLPPGGPASQAPRPSGAWPRSAAPPRQAAGPLGGSAGRTLRTVGS